VVLPGIKIGEGAVVGANSVVTKDVRPYTIVGGSPARVIREVCVPWNEEIKDRAP
jgi:acetyltransferase-like isoleucine patch superfamily enzyme